MIERYVGEEVWQRAIRAYIREHAWGNTTERDLWDAVAKESGLDVYSIASAFLNQPGFDQFRILARRLRSTVEIQIRWTVA